MGINLPANGCNAGKPRAENFGMRSFSFILALGFVLAGPSMAGSVDSNLPGVGTFAYSGSPILDSASRTMIVAAR